MSIYVLLDFVERCKSNNVIPTWDKLNEYKRMYWRD